MWTRRTALRVALSQQFLERGDLASAHWLLPRKWKQDLSPVCIEARKRFVYALQMMRPLFTQARRDLEYLSGDERIGTTIRIRNPCRYITKEKP